MTEEPGRTLQLGRLGRTVGLDGGLLFHAAGPAEAGLLVEGVTVLVQDHGEFMVSEARRHNRGLVLFLTGIRRVERARELTGQPVTIQLDQLPSGFQATDLGAGLLGLPVLLDGQPVGNVAAVEGASGHEYLRLEPDGQLLPLNAPYVQVLVDMVTVTDPPAGLL